MNTGREIRIGVIGAGGRGTLAVTIFPVDKLSA